MSRHWRRITVLIVLAVGSFTAAITAKSYMLAIFTLLAAVFGFAGYAIGLAHFHGRPDDRSDSEGRQRNAPL
jgi:hypothetical protein